MAQIGELALLLTGESKSWTDAIKDAGKGLDDLRKQATLAGTDFSKFNASTINIIKAWKNDVGEAYRGLDSNLQVVKKGLVDQGQALNVNQKGMTTMALQTVIANEKLKAMSDSLKGLSNSLWLMSSGLQQVGRSMTTAFTIPIAAAAGLAVKTFTEWESSTVAIQRAAEITSEEANVITDNFIKISQQVPLTVEDLQKAGYAAAQAGVTGAEGITNFAKAAVMLAKVGGDAVKGLPIEDLANKLAKLGIAFGETGDNWERVNNIASTLLVVAKAVPGGLAEVIDGMKRSAGAAVTMGLSLADTTALIGTLVAAGVPASRAGTELSRILLDIAKNSDKVAQALGYANNQVGEFKDRMQNDVMGVLTELISRYGEVGNRVDLISHLQEIFGDVALRSLLPLIQNVDILRDLQARANQELESGALLSAEFATQANSLSGSFTVFGNTLKSVGYALGKDLAPYVNYFLKVASTALTNLAKGWQSLNPTIKAAVLIFGALLAIIGPLALILNTLFIAPLSGMITFVTFATKAATSLGLVSITGGLAGISMKTFGSSMVAALSVIPKLIAGLVSLSISFLGILAAIALVAAAIYGLGKLFGVKLKLPSMPKINLPKYNTGGGKGKVNATQESDLAQADSDSAKKEQTLLEKELRDKKKIDDKNLQLKEDAVDAYQKVMDKEVAVAQKSVDNQQDLLDAKKEAWDDEKRLANEQIDAQDDIVKTTKKTLEAAKKQLNKLKDARDKELDVAEGGVDYAKMNLEAAQNALKREKTLGHDEFDATFRAAEERVKVAEKAVALAELNELKIKKSWQDQITAQEEIVNTTQDQVDTQQDALDKLKEALDNRTRIVDAEVDVLDDELKVRKDALDKVKASDQEKLDILKEEKSQLQRKYDDEEQVIQDRLDAVKDQVDAIKALPVPELPDLAGDMGLLDEQVQKQIDDLQNQIGQSLKFGLEATPGGLWDRMKTAFDDATVKAKDAGHGTVVAYIEGFYASLTELSNTLNRPFFDAIFGKGAWDTKMAQGTKFWENAGEWGKNLLRRMKDGLLSGLNDLGDIGGRIMTTVGNSLSSWWNSAWNWGRDMMGKFAQGIWDGMAWVKDAVNNMAGWLRGILHFSEPDFGPLKGMADWGKDLVRTYGNAIQSELPYLEGVLNGVNVDLEKNLIGTNSIGSANSNQTQTAPASSVIKNYYIQPGQMIASRGEVRNFVRMLKEYDTFEEGR